MIFFPYDFFSIGRCEGVIFLFVKKGMMMKFSQTWSSTLGATNSTQGNFVLFYCQKGIYFYGAPSSEVTSESYKLSLLFCITNNNFFIFR